MRLICPNCGAQYEVDASVIPDSGRDVQCANCGHTWFQRAPHLDRELAEEMGQSLPEDIELDEFDVTEPAPEKPARNRSDVAAASAASAAAAATPRPEPAAERRRRELSPEIADMLREEAALEQAARKAERGGQIESQPDLGLDETPATEPRVAPARARVRKITPAEDDGYSGDDGGSLTPGARREQARRAGQLPDVEEINSTLRPSRHERPRVEAAEAEFADEPRSRGGFRTGFLLVILAAFVGAAAYLFAPRIAEAVPGFQEPLEGYVAWVNETRVGVDAWLQTALVDAQDFAQGVMSQVQGMTGGSEPVE